MLYVALSLVTVACAVLFWRLIKSGAELKRYSMITDIEAESIKLRSQLESELSQKRSDSEKVLTDLSKSITQSQREALEHKERSTELSKERLSLEREVSLLNEESDLLSAGFYKSKYNFQKSEKYAALLDSKRDFQKAAIKAKDAIVCNTQWTVGGSAAEGKKMTDRVIKLGLSAFNVQCDNEILRVKFDNIDKAGERIAKIRDNVNKLLEPNQCRITDNFYNLKVEELYLTYEYVQKVYEEKEEQKAIREQMREEDKARREAERAQAEAEKEERRVQIALIKARAELATKSGEENLLLQAKIAALEQSLSAALQSKERAKSMAELTRQGHVYIISNVGSFGENVFKIGMTRRLDPMDRVWELGDASVPFDFDVHAIIKSDDAPALENKLHKEFDKVRLNRVNLRKEFFKVELADIERACRATVSTEFKLTKIAEASEWRRTVALAAHEQKNAA